jgi:hypothetical protein
MGSNGGVGSQPAHGRSSRSDGTTTGTMPTAPWEGASIPPKTRKHCRGSVYPIASIGSRNRQTVGSDVFRPDGSAREHTDMTLRGTEYSGTVRSETGPVTETENRGRQPRPMRTPDCQLTLSLSLPQPLQTTVAPWHGPSLRGGDPFDSLRSLRVTWGSKRRTRAEAIGPGLRLRCRTWTRTRLHPGAATPSSPHSGQDAHCTIGSIGGVGFQPAHGRSPPE